MRGRKRRASEEIHELYYFPERLRSRLTGIASHPFTLVEAPSGFGKTTAVREYLRKNRTENAHVNWYTCLGEPPSRAWNAICDLFAPAGFDVAAGLKRLGALTMETLADAASLVRKCRVQTETFLVIDNYQLMESDIPWGIMRAFSVHGNDTLHVIFITQPLPLEDRFVSGGSDIHLIDSGMFFFDRDSIAKYFALSGSRLSEYEINAVDDSTGGWVAAVRLQLINYRENGKFADKSGMDGLIETAIWDRLNPYERDFLLSLSLFHSFTPKQAAIMLNAPSLPQNAERFLRLHQNAFIPYSGEQGVYYMHTLLRDYLRKRFNNAADGFRFETLRRLGAAHNSAANYHGAGEAYLLIKDYDAALSQAFTTQYLNANRESGVLDFIARLVDECCDDMLRRHPFVILAFAFQFLQNGQKERFGRIIRIVQGLTDDTEERRRLSNEEMSSLKGETAFLLSFTHFNDIRRMSACHREALAYLGTSMREPRTVIFGTTPWTFGITSVVCLFWRHPGGLEDNLSQMDECMPIYVELSGGHGSGADAAMRAEALLLQGDDAGAEILCHRALYQAAAAHQTSICLCAELTLARVAILRGNGDGYLTARNHIAHYASETHERSLLRMAELCMAFLRLLFGELGEIADWLRDIEKIRKTLPVQGQPYALMLHNMILTAEKAHAKLYGLTEPVMSLASGLNYVLPQVYQRIFLAIAAKHTGQANEADEHLRAALLSALPDKVYLPFAEHAPSILPMLESLRRDFGDDDERMNTLIALCLRQTAGTVSVRKALYREKSLLTPRQREIALLLRDRYSVKEIALELFVAESTVKSAKKIIYGILDIHSKAELAKMEF